MEKIRFCLDDEEVEFYVLEQTKVNGINYILVTDSLENESECFILRDISDSSQADSLYEPVEDEQEMQALGRVFEELLEDVDIKM